MSPSIFFQTLISTINAFQAYDYIYMLTRRGRADDYVEIHHLGDRLPDKLRRALGISIHKRGENSVASPAVVAAVPAPVQAAVDKLADSLRPDADEPAEGRRRVIMPKAADATVPPLTIGVARGRVVGEPVTRREFRRTDTLVVRAHRPASGAEAGPVTVFGRLLDRRGQPLTDLPLTPGSETPELRLTLGNLGPGDYVIELAQQYIAFRVVR